MFDRYIGIDYSGAKSPSHSLKGLRVFSATRKNEPSQVWPAPSPKKYWTRESLAQWLAEELLKDQRTLVGIDHAFSFPEQYFDDHRWKKDWPEFLDRFHKRWGTDGSTVWVRSMRFPPDGNGSSRPGYATLKRRTELRTKGAKSVFHFDVPGSVAKSTHAGLPWLRYLRNRLKPHVHFWPFDGWNVEAKRSVIAEVYPALWQDYRPRVDMTGDERDAFAVASWLRASDAKHVLKSAFEPDLSEVERECARFEGWILGS